MSPLAATTPAPRRAVRSGVGVGIQRDAGDLQRSEVGLSRPRLRVVDDSNLRSAARRKRARLFAVVATAVVVTSLFGLVALHAVLVQGQVKVDTLAKQVAGEQAHYQELRREVAELESPQRVVNEAVGRLGMVQPQEVTYLTSPQGAAASEEGSAVESDVSHGERPWASVKPYLGAGS